MSINHIVTELDSAVLDSKAHYVFYHKMIDFVLKELIVGIQRHQLCTNQELTFFKQYSDLLLYSIEAMRIKYMYDDEDSMKVDVTESGFPNYLEFRYLFNDLELAKEHIEKLTDETTLKETFLDTLLKRKEPIKRSKLFQAASIVYYSSVKNEYIFNRFVQGKIIDAPKDAVADFLVSWSFYDVSHNRPFMCFMYFDYDGTNINDYKNAIYQILKTTSDREMPLDTMAYAIDRKLTKLSPRLIKRIDLGPLHSVFAKDENEVTHALLHSISKKEIPLESYAVSIKIDQVISESEFKEGGFFSKQTLQKWDVIATKKYVFASHRIIQLLYNKTPEMMNGLDKPPIELAELIINIKK